MPGKLNESVAPLAKLLNADPLDVLAMLYETASYSLSLNGQVMFCRMCANLVVCSENVQARYCPHCGIHHDNLQLERFLRGQQ